MRGISFEIPNEYGQYLADILKAVDIEKWDWKQGGWNESYVIENEELGRSLLGDKIFNGNILCKLITEQDYYLIFVDIKAFPENSLTAVETVSTYQEFLESDCQVVLLLVDSSYVFLYLKDQSIIRKTYTMAQTAAFENVSFITEENDPNPSLIN